MNELFGTTTAIEEARFTGKRYSFLRIAVSFLLVYYIASMLSGIFLAIPTLYYVFSTESVNAVIESGQTDQEAISDALNKALEDAPEWLNAMSLFSTAGIIIVTLFFCLKIEKRTLFSMGFCKKGALKEYAVGLIIGAFMFFGVYAILSSFGQVNISLNADVSIGTVLLFFLGFAVQGMGEEILLRGFYFVSTCNSSSVAISVFTSSALFALLHLNNSGIGILPLLNLFLFGVFAALHFLRRGNIWGISAIHTMWNFAQGNIFGFKVSGSATGGSVFEAIINGNNTLLNGGDFGPEGGVAVTIVLFVGIVILLCMKNKHIEPDRNSAMMYFNV